MRKEKSYNGVLMKKGLANEDIILDWLKTLGKEVIDFREFRLAQRIDVDFGIETIDGKIVLAEIKSDKWISEQGNLLFDAQIAAVCKEHGIKDLLSEDRDFARFYCIMLHCLWLQSILGLFSYLTKAFYILKMFIQSLLLLYFIKI